MRVILAKQYQGDTAVGGPEAALHRGTTRSFSAFLYRVGGASEEPRLWRGQCAYVHICIGGNVYRNGSLYLHASHLPFTFKSHGAAGFLA